MRYLTMIACVLALGAHANAQTTNCFSNSFGNSTYTNCSTWPQPQQQYAPSFPQYIPPPQPMQTIGPYNGITQIRPVGRY